MSKKAEITHVDLLGHELHVGDFVAAHYYRQLEICTVTKLNPKMVQIKPVSAKWKKNVYPHDMVRVSEDDVTMYLLRQAKK